MKLMVLWTALCAALASIAPAQAAVTVNVRIEGSATTYFEGPVTTGAHDVQGHRCTPPGEPAPSPTMITALDDLSLTGVVFWAGTWNESFGDFFVDEVGSGSGAARTSDKGGTTTYWVLARNFKATEAGGCQTAVKEGDRVLFAYGSEIRPLLELSGVPERAEVGESFDVLVSQHTTNQAQPDGVDAPAVGAAVEGRTAGPDGIVRLSFDEPGVKRFKATRQGAVRSNAGQVCVYAKGSGGCDTAPPAPTAGDGGAVRTPRATVSVSSVGRRRLRGSATGPGVKRVEVRLRRRLDGRCSFLSPRKRRFVSSPSCGRTAWIGLAVRDSHWTLALPRRLGPGRYVVDVRAGKAAAQRRFRMT